MVKGVQGYPVDLGVLGGMGPRATGYFVEQILRCVEEIHHPLSDQQYPNLLVRYASYLPDRSESLERNKVEELAGMMGRELEVLRDQGCPRIAIPCISAFMIANRLMDKYPIIDTPGLVRGYISTRHRGAKIGVLSTTGARKTGVIYGFVDAGQELELLTKEEQRILMEYVYRTAKTWKKGQSAAPLLRLAENLRRRGCQVVVAGCTEVEMCLGEKREGDETLVFPLRLTAMDFAEKWKGRKAHEDS